ncbi:PAS domain S-box-containing protein [Singulisphaera sp. GP187]|uniref:PAS domain S-box protein n=1 Tax=Singulisphaera sp. GP187 TaxID=1882752 RepID=UPI00092BFF28|nr:PAS domain S-box protein [Singulisphaera sp. GP187]SIO47168.1 PAS domain S-box-containing protein [Singulisphaera sp. GP187]
MIDSDGSVQASARLASLRETGLLDSPAELSFDRLTRLVARFLKVPIALISLVDDRRQYFKSCLGLPEPWATARETPLTHSFCRHVVASSEPLIVGNARTHPLVRDNPAIDELGVVAYLGVPLTTTDGLVLGAICAIDREPREWTEDEVAALTDLACSVMTEITLRRDVADRRSAERLLDRYRLLSQHARDIVLFVRTDGRIVEANDAAIAAYGYDRDTLLRMSILELRDSETVAFVPDQMAQADVQGVTFETVHRRKDGSTFPVEVSSRGAEIAGERLLLSILRDISERRRAEEELRHSRERLSETLAQLEALVAGAPFALALLDSDLRFVRLNEAMARLNGEPTSVHLGRSYGEIVSAAAAIDESALREVIETGVPRLGVYHEGEMPGLPGYVGRWLSNWYPVCATDGRVLGVGIMTAEITEQMRSEAALRYSERRYRTLIDGVLQLMWVNDPDGRTIFFNRRWREYSGFAPELLTGLSWPNVVHPEDLVRLRQIRDVSIQSGEPYECEYRLRNRDGEFRWHIARVVPMIDRGGKVENWFGVATDIHDLKRAEGELRAARDAAEAGTRARDQFMAVLSHELRTPLTPVLVSVTAMLEDPETPESVRPALEVTKRNIALEARLIDDLLDITRITQGKLNLGREIVDAHELIRRAVEICRDEVGTAGIALSMHLVATAHHVDGDPARLQQIFWNLIKNAVKFTRKGGMVVINSYDVDGPAGPRLVVEVRDTGVGIAPEALPKIFNAFEQGDNEVTRQFGGLGLGLAISRNLTEAHGGTLTASSGGRGQGATFVLRLPVATVPVPYATIPAPRIETSRPPASLHILLVEDNADTLRVMSRLLRRRGYQVTSASCFTLALEAVERDEPFNLVVSDIGLPDGSGLELMRRIRAQRDVKGIAVSGYGMEDDVRKSRDAGFCLHLTKPVDFPALEQAIQQVARLEAEEPVNP